MTNTTDKSKNQLVSELSKVAKGVSFIGVNYTNQQDETSQYLINVGISFDNAKKKDVEILTKLDTTKITDYKGLDSEAIELVSSVKQTLIDALIKPNKAMSEAQKNAYTHITSGMKIHNESYELFVFGFKVKKNVQVKGDYKETAFVYEGANASTRAKNFLRVNFMKSTKYRQFKITREQSHNYKLNGEQITFE